MTLHTIIQAAKDDAPALAWQLTHSGAIRRSDGACLLEAAAGTGPYTLWTKASAKLAPLDARSLERISCATDMDWWPHRMAEWGIRQAALDMLGLEDCIDVTCEQEAA